MNRPFFSHDFAGDATAFDASRPWIERGHNALWLIGALWLECTIVWLIWYWGSFAHLDFRDPDDAMRLVQVRDFLAGQSWFDVSQHRVNPPIGGPMHWSRLLDLPIAGIIVALRPLVGERMAEIVACVSVPPLTLATLSLSTYAALKRFLGVNRTVLVVALLVTSFPILTQMAPLRIDHHAWQIVASVGVLGGVLALDARKGGWIAGASMAMWLHISGEALPYVVITGAVLTFRYAMKLEEWARLIRFVGVLALCSAVLLFVTHGWTASLVAHCDAMSPPYLLPLLVIFPLMLIGHNVAGEATLMRRIAPLAMAGLAGAAVFVSTAPQCMAGPFAMLGPNVYKYWLVDVMEGQPFWKQEPGVAAIVIAPALVGLLGLIAASVTEENKHRQMQWLSILGLALGSFAVSAFVLRAMSVSHMVALVGNGWIIAWLYPKVARKSHMATRVLLTVSLCLLTPAGLAVASSEMASAVTGRPIAPVEEDKCFDADQIARLAELPRTTLFAPIDMGPEILLRTRHDVIATAHHRNFLGIEKVIDAYLASPLEARKVVHATQARYFLFCPALNETQRFTKIAPGGLAAQITAGHVPAWLTPVKLPGVTAVQVYKTR